MAWYAIAMGVKSGKKITDAENQTIEARSAYSYLMAAFVTLYIYWKKQ
jgi:hypothetical protein